MSALSKAVASVPPLLSPSWSLNFNGTLILCWNYSFWVTQKPEKNMEQNKNESWQRAGIIIPGLFLIGFQGIYNTWIQSLLSFAVLQQHSGSIMRQQAEQSRDSETRHFAALSSLQSKKAVIAMAVVTHYYASYVAEGKQITKLSVKGHVYNQVVILDSSQGCRSGCCRPHINIHARCSVKLYPGRCRPL